MIEIRFHGRGGQGAVIASTLLASACSKENKHVLAFPLFGFERRGAPVMAFARLSDEPILLRCQVYEPDHVVVLDPSLIKVSNITAGLKRGGWIVINSERSPAAFGFPPEFNVACVDATSIAVNNRLGSRNAPIVNTAILGAFARATGIVSVSAILAAVKEEAPTKPEANAAAVIEAHDKVELASFGRQNQ